MRGTWFKYPSANQGVPIDDEEMADQLEKAHVQLIKDFHENEILSSDNDASPNINDESNASAPAQGGSDKEAYSTLGSLFASSSKAQCTQLFSKGVIFYSLKYNTQLAPPPF